MNNFKEKIVFYSHFLICVVGAVAAAFLGVKYLFPLILPFLIAWGIAYLSKKPSRFVSRKTGIPEKIIRPVFALVLILSVLGGLFYLIFILVSEAWQLLSGFSEGGVAGVIDKFFSAVAEMFGNSENAKALAEYLRNAAGGVVGSLLSSLASVITSFAASVPAVVIFLIVTVISSVYFSSDLESINSAVLNLLPPGIRQKFLNFKNTSLKLALSYLRSYLLIMLITFAVVFPGLLFLRVKYAFLIAIAIAFLDFLPLIGIGTVMIPWSLWNFIIGRGRLAVGILILFGVAEVVRQFAEPKILGKSLGIHPVVTLVLLYVCYTLFGFWGLLLMPVFAIVINTLLKKEKP